MMVELTTLRACKAVKKPESFMTLFAGKLTDTS